MTSKPSRRPARRANAGSSSGRGRARLLAKAAKPAISSHPGRLFVLALTAVIVLGIPFRDQFLELFGWSAIPLGVWAGWIVFLVTGRPGVLRTRWRETVGALFFALAGSAALGIIRTPVDSSIGDSMAGYIGVALAREPFDWENQPFTDVSSGEYLVAGLRVSVLFAISIAVLSPPVALRAAVAAGKGTAAALSLSIAAAEGIRERYQKWSHARKETRRLRAEDQAAYETDQALHAEDVDEPAQAEPAIVPPLANAARRDSALEVESEPAAILESETPSESSGQTPAVIATRPIFDWPKPSIDLLREARAGGVTRAEIEATSQLIEDSLRQYGIEVTVDQVRSGPTVTMYGLKPGWKGGDADGQAAGKRVRVDAILSREKDLALALASPSLRFEAVVPGESVVGIEVPNANPTSVTLRSVMNTPEWAEFEREAHLPVPLGLGSGGEPVFADLARMPHTLVAGATGSGKSVCMNAIITGLLMTRTPYEVRMVMIDPKRVELTPYAEIPHLYTPVVVEGDRAIVILRSLVNEMMGRFRRLEQVGVKNIVAHNEKSVEKMPYLVTVVDELADLMISAPKDVERLLVRLAQLGRATGVHLVVATQRPSVDVVTGLIKANFPSRISFAVMSQIDSRTVLDSPGGEKLLGRGDMLFLPIDRAKPHRVQGAFLSEPEIESVAEFWRNAGGPPLPELDVSIEEDRGGSINVGLNGDADSMLEKAASLARTQKTLSTSLLQRRLRIGYPRAARLMDELEEDGIVGPGEPGKPRQVIG